MSHKKYNRRAFIEKLTGGCAAIGVTSLLSGITNMGLINAAAAANTSLLRPQNSYKALVCILLSGGNDSFNMLIPRGVSEYDEYAAMRTNLSIPRNNLLPISPNTSIGKELGLHPNLPDLKNIFDQGDLAFMANVGTLVEPTTKQQYNAQLTKLPAGLFSHSDQQKHWQTSVPQNRQQATGWGGRMADILYTSNQNQNVSMNIALDTGNIFQKGNVVLPYVINSNQGGSILLRGATSNNVLEQIKRQTLDNLLDATYQNTLETAYAQSVRDAVGTSFEFNTAIASGQVLTTPFGTDSLSTRLKVTAQTIAARDALNMQQQTFFISAGGFDTHGSVQEHDDLMTVVNDALKSFYDALGELGVRDQVTTFTISDFGRKLLSNGSGSDHAWGGNCFVMGGAVRGKDIYGEYPDLYEGSPLEFGGGRFIPTLSCDEYFAELALWFGASSSDLDQILPNIPNFWTPNSSGGPVGFMNI